MRKQCKGDIDFLRVYLNVSFYVENNYFFQEPVSLKCMLSYTMDDETFTEMGEVDTLPNL